MLGSVNRGIKSSLRRDIKNIKVQNLNVPFLQTLLAMSNPKYSCKRPFQPSTSCRFGLPASANNSTRHTQVSTQVSALPTIIQCSLLNVAMHVPKAVPERYKLSRGIPSANGGLTAERNSVTPPRSFTSLVPNCRVPEIDYNNPLPAPSGDLLLIFQFYIDDCEFPSSYQEPKAFRESPPGHCDRCK